MDRQKLIKSLEIDEGIRLFPYLCSEKRYTIGIGRNFQDNPFTLTELIYLGLKARTFETILAELKQKGLTKSDCYYLLNNDIDSVEQQLTKNLSWFVSAPEPIQRALTNLCFNMGWGKLSQFKKTLALLKTGQYEQASKEVLNSKWASQVGLRSVRISNLIKQAINPK